ncbi:penicillin-binding protein 2 [Persephonella atlantica]|uniref:Penicillin-binding protein 2 n=1 Tax=Persephonella atlantica TaxID=2699429 RepID=A0ABS1GJQ1_9AQUI|nr:penicillin-binding protein 2 [Persephonella atlantica]MBK3333164.1 penicillin-binding protein 2 [Persephonella atlantica]
MKSGRLRIIALLFLIGYLILFSRLFYLQVLKGDFYRKLSEKNHIRIMVVNPPRGKIYDRNGILLAYDEPSFQIYTYPYMVKKRLKLLKDRLKEILGIEIKDDIYERLKKGYANKVILKKRLTQEQIKKFINHWQDFEGLFLEVQPRRVYTEYARYMPHLLGYVGYPSKNELNKNPMLTPDMLIGKSGVEKIFDRYLRGSYGMRAVVVDAKGRIVKTLWEKQPRRGSDIYLTIDARVQKIVYEAFKQSGQKSGAVVVVNPKDYSIIALLSYPIYDIQKFADGLSVKEWKALLKNRYKPLFNKALDGLYPPGSIFKITVALAALQEGVVAPYQKIFSGAEFKIGKWVYRNWDPRGCGYVDVMGALEVSCDTYFYQIGVKLGSERISYYARMFGLGEKLNPQIEKRVSRIPDPEWKAEFIGEPWYLGDTVNYSIGQGFLAITPFDSTKILVPVLNGGYLLKPRLLKAYYDMSKMRFITVKTEVIRKLNLKRFYFRVIKKGLYDVVYGKNGTAKLLSTLPVKNAGKTGTAQVFRHKKRKEKIEKWYLQNHAWFVDFVPYRKPEYLISVFVEHGIGGARTAVPITKSIIQKMYGEGLIR